MITDGWLRCLVYRRFRHGNIPTPLPLWLLYLDNIRYLLSISTEGRQM